MVRPSYVPFALPRPHGRPGRPQYLRKLQNDAPETLVQRIERETKRTLTLETSLEANISKCHPQDQSVLYNTLPKEIRDLIFAFATAPFEDLDHQYSDDERYYRPGYRAPRKVATNLLLTCRRVWLEANALPVRQAMFTFWYFMAPPSVAEPRPVGLTALNEQNVTGVQLFLQLCEAESILDNREALGQWMDWLKPKVLRVTIRHSDWWDWEYHVPLELRKDGWVQTMLNSACVQGIEQVHLELETIDSKKGQLDPIVQRLQRLESTPRHLSPNEPNCCVGVYLRTKEAPKTWYWTGSAGLKGNPKGDGAAFSTPHLGLAKLDYYVKVITWQLARTEMEPPTTATSHSTQSTSPAPLWPPRFMGHRGPLRRAGRRQAGFQTSPAYLHNPSLHSSMQEHGWDRLPFAITNDEVQYHSMAYADDLEGRRREQFEQALADLTARKYQTQWEEQDSLLKFLPSPH